MAEVTDRMVEAAQEWMRERAGYLTLTDEFVRGLIEAALSEQRVPLTEEEIYQCFQQRSRDKVIERRLITRAIERMHGIGGEE